MNIKKIFSINAFEIKLLGIMLMVFDHIAQFFTFAPIWFHWLGRPVAPLFLFLASEGYIHTKSRPKYLFRLLVGFWATSLLTTVLLYVTDAKAGPIPNNIFGTLFISVLYMCLIDLFKNALTKKNNLRLLFISALMVVPLYLNTLFILTIPQSNLSFIYKAVTLIIPMPLLVEGGISIVALTCLFYIFHSNKYMQIFCLFVYATLSYLSNPVDPFFQNYQWMLVFSALPIVFYNKQKGYPAQLFFYTFYPAHICVIYILAVLLQK